MEKWFNRCPRILRRMKQVLVYKGLGMYEQDTAIVVRMLKEHVNTHLYQVDTVSAEEIIKGRLADGTALLAVGGGYDLGLIQALGHHGMTNIKDYVTAGGSYLGICSGAYFACDRIEFDKGGPLEVLGVRFLKFYSGTGVGPLFKPYDYQSRKGASAVKVDFTLNHLEETRNQIKYDSIGNQFAMNDSSCDSGNQLAGTKNQYHNADAENHLRETVGQNQFQGSVNQKAAPLNENCDNCTDRSENYESLERGLTESQLQQKESQTSNLIKESQEFLAPNSDSKVNLQAAESVTKDALDSQFKQSCDTKLNSTILYSNDEISDTFNCKVYFNGGNYFRMNSDRSQDGIKVLSHYLDLPDSPAAIVQNQVGAGVVVLSGVHLEYDAEDIDDGDDTVIDIIPFLRDSSRHRRSMIRSILQQLNIVIN